MRQSKRPVDFLFPRVRQAVLTSLLSDPSRSWYRSDLAKHLRLRPSSLQRELDGLVRAGVLSRRTEGNRSYLQADQSCPFLEELRGLIEKTVGLVAQLGRVLEPFKAKVAVAFIFGSVARGTERSESDVDLMVVGTLGVKELVPGLREVEGRLGRPVNVHTYTPKEFAEKVRAKHHFVTEVLAREKVFVTGSKHDLDALLEARTG
jgi:predicted nucleotidyltransferase